MAQSIKEFAVPMTYEARRDGTADPGQKVTEKRSVQAPAVLQCLASLRHQMAVARTVLDELEDNVSASNRLRAPHAQVAEELMRLGSRVFDAAAALGEQEESEREKAAFLSGGPTWDIDGACARCRRARSR